MSRSIVSLIFLVATVLVGTLSRERLRSQFLGYATPEEHQCLPADSPLPS